MDLKCTICVLASWITVTCARHWCEVYKKDSLEPLPERIWCDTGCCGSRYDVHCCHVQSEISIVEGVLGALGGFFLLLSIVITVCCCRSHYRKTRSHQIAITPISSGIIPDMKPYYHANI